MGMRSCMRSAAYVQLCAREPHGLRVFLSLQKGHRPLRLFLSKQQQQQQKKKKKKKKTTQKTNKQNPPKTNQNNNSLPQKTNNNTNKRNELEHLSDVADDDSLHVTDVGGGQPQQHPAKVPDPLVDVLDPAPPPAPPTSLVLLLLGVVGRLEEDEDGAHGQHTHTQVDECEQLVEVDRRCVVRGPPCLDGEEGQGVDPLPVPSHPLGRRGVGVEIVVMASAFLPPIFSAVEMRGRDEPRAEEVPEDLRRMQGDDRHRLEEPHRLVWRQRGQGGVGQPVAKDQAVLQAPEGRHAQPHQAGRWQQGERRGDDVRHGVEDVKEERGEQQALGPDSLQDDARQQAAQHVGAVHAAQRHLAQVSGHVQAGLQVAARHDGEDSQEAGRALRDEVPPDATAFVVLLLLVVLRCLLVGRWDVVLGAEALVAHPLLSEGDALGLAARLLRRHGQAAWVGRGASASE